MRVHRPEAFFARVGGDGLIGFGESYLSRRLGRRRPRRLPDRAAPPTSPTLVPRRCRRLRALYVPGRPRSERNTSRQQPRPTSPTTTTCPTTCSRFPGRDDDLLLGAVRHPVATTDQPGTVAARGEPRPIAAEAQGRKIERLLDRTRRRRGHPAAGDRHRLGRARHPRRPPRRAGPLGHAVLGAAGAWPGVGSPPAGLRRPGERRALRLPRDPGPATYDAVRLGGDDRGGRPRVLAGVLPDPGPGARARRPGRAAGDHDAARPDARHPPHATPGSTSTSSPAASSRRSRRSSEVTRAHTTLRVTERLSFGSHYAETLRRWDATFHAGRGRVRALGFDETFQRMWHFYLEYSRGRLRLRLPRRRSRSSSNARSRLSTGAGTPPPPAPAGCCRSPRAARA